MLLSEHTTTIYRKKSRSSEDHRGISLNDEGGATKTPYDLIEHDVSGLNILTTLPKPDSFDALQIGSDR